MFVGELNHRFAGQVRIGDSCTGVEQTKEVIHFRHGAYGRTRIAAGGLLVNGDDGTQAGYLIHVRTLHLSDEPAGVGGERVHVPALTFGEDGIECQR